MAFSRDSKPGRGRTGVASFLEGALPLAEQEEATSAWFAIRLGPSTFGIFDVFPDGTVAKRTSPDRS